MAPVHAYIISTLYVENCGLKIVVNPLTISIIVQLSNLRVSSGFNGNAFEDNYSNDDDDGDQEIKVSSGLTANDFYGNNSNDDNDGDYEKKFE